jgi:hypothetical protein
MTNESKILLAGGIGLILSDIIPTPADAWYFKLQSKWKSELEDKKITPKQYWTKNALAYYGLNPLYWSGILAITFAIGQNPREKLGIFAALLAGGAVIGVLSKNIKKDVERYKG